MTTPVPVPFDVNALALLRSRRQAFKTYVAIEQPRVVWTGVVAAGFSSVGATRIPWETGDVVVDEWYTNFTLLVGTSAGGSDVGVVRFRTYHPSGDLLVGFNHIDWQAGQFLTIVEQVRPWTLFPNFSMTEVTVEGLSSEQKYTIFIEYWEDQDRAYTDENTNIPPIARIGPSAAVAFVDASGKARLKFYSNSQAVTGSLASHYWEFNGGTPSTSAVAGTDSSPIVVEWSEPGQYMVNYVVTDSNGKEHRRHCRVYIFDRDLAPPFTNFEIATLSGSRDECGYTASIKFNGLKRTDFVDGAQVVIFGEQFYGSAQTDIGTGTWKYRENLLFVGWLKNARTQEAYAKDTAEFECIGPMGWMESAMGWPVNLAHTRMLPNPDEKSDIKVPMTGMTDWHIIPGMTPDLAALHLLREHTNILNLADFYPTGDNRDLRYVDCGESQIKEQVNTHVYESIRATVVCDRTGVMFTEVNQQLVPVANRVGQVMLDVTSQDWREQLGITEEIFNPRTSQIDMLTFYYDGQDRGVNWGSLAPFRELSTGSVEKVTGIRASSQDESNVVSGLYLAWKNNEFNEVAVPLVGFWPIEISPQQRVRITLTGTETSRRLVWDAKVFWVKGVTHAIKPQFIQTDLRLEAESWGPPGVTNPLDQLLRTTKPDNNQPDLPWVPNAASVSDETNAGLIDTVFLVWNDRVFRSENFGINSAWDEITGAITQ